MVGVAVLERRMCLLGQDIKETNEEQMPQHLPLHSWWRRMDSNHRRRSQQIYSLSPLATWVLLRID